MLLRTNVGRDVAFGFFVLFFFTSLMLLWKEIILSVKKETTLCLSSANFKTTSQLNDLFNYLACNNVNFCDMEN